jgi:serine/threonine protein phosphatase PrpC
MQYISSSLTDVGRVRSANEDNHGEAQTPNGHVFVVCDGMGGHVGGATASKIAVSSILEYFSKEKHENLIQALDRALVFANEQVYAQALSDPGLKGMGTTALVLFIRGDECYIGHVGDSRIYIKSGDKLNRLTKDHSFVQTLVDSGVISDEDAESHPNKNQILKALGISPNLEPTICQSPILPQKGDVFMLCSDGMNGMVNDRSMEMMIDFEDLNRSSRTLIQAALDAGGHDNVTVTLVGITESPHAISRFKHYNPKPNFDASGTQNFDSSAQTGQSNQNKKWLYAALGLIVVALFFVTYIKFFYSPDSSDSAGDEKLYSKEDLEAWAFGNRSFLWNINVECEDDTLLICDDRIQVVISNNKVIDVAEVLKVVNGKVTVKPVEKPPLKKKSKQRPSNEAPQSSTNGDPNPNQGTNSDDENENQFPPPPDNSSSGANDGGSGDNPPPADPPASKVKTFECKVGDKKGSNKMKNLTKICEYYNSHGCPNLTVADIKSQNNLNGDDIDIGQVLKITCKCD